MDERTRHLDLIAPIPTGNTKVAAAAAGATSADLWMVPYGQLHYDPADNIRPVDPEWVTHLTALIVENGYDKGSPLHCYVRKVDGKDLLYVYKGQHRYLAAGKAIEAGKDVGKIPVVVRDAKTVSRAEMVIDGYLSNDSKRSSPLELAGVVAELRDIHGMTLAAICKRLNVTDQTVRDVGLLERAPVETAPDGSRWRSCRHAGDRADSRTRGRKSSRTTSERCGEGIGVRQGPRDEETPRRIARRSTASRSAARSPAREIAEARATIRAIERTRQDRRAAGKATFARAASSAA